MAHELAYIDHSTTGQTVYYAVLTSGANCINASTGASQALTSGNWQSAAIALSDTGHAGHYLASVPANTAAGRYLWKVYQSSGTPSSTAAISDAEISGSDSVNWSGTAEVALSSIASSASTAATQATTAATSAATIDTKLGTPAGASVSDDIAAITASAAAASTTATAINTKLGTPAGASVSADIAAITNAASGPGADQVTITINDGDANPVIDAAVWITNSPDVNDVEAGTLRTNAQGKATFLLDAGSTYYLWMKAERINPIVGETFVAVADT